MTGRDEEQWDFWIDRGGTFTDIVARGPDGRILTHKLLSENPERYQDAAIAGIRQLLDVSADAPLPAERIRSVKMGTTVATNALLERKGDPTLLVTTRGFRDALRIGYQVRPKLFELDIRLPEMLYTRVVEADERKTAHGHVQRQLDEEAIRRDLEDAWTQGIRGVAIVLMHGYRYPRHEQRIAAIARDIGFSQVSTSYETSPLMKLVSRGDTTVVDAYLSPILRRYVDHVSAEIGDTRLLFMQSNGGLADAHYFQGKDAILSGPAGGVVGMVRTAKTAGYGKVIGFDMGGTSTDVSHYDGEFERSMETNVAGVRLRAPMMLIHTVAAGGGSILHFDGARFRVGPESAGAFPGPACYGNGGPLTVTDCNVMLGRIQKDFFPRVFGQNGNQPIDVETVREKFATLADRIRKETGDTRTPEQVAEGFLAVAVENMASAIKHVSVQRGHDVSDYLLNCFGGAGGQHACAVADALGMKRVLLHPFAGVLSAYGIGVADLRLTRQRAIEAELDDSLMASLQSIIDRLEAEGREEMRAQDVDENCLRCIKRVHLKYAGTDTALAVLPGGSTNVFARTMGIPNDPIEATGVLLEALGRGAIERVGLGSVNGRYFLFHVGLGFDAEVVRQVERRSA
ncbi:MAG: 5-oxoprolinase, partial [Proteobacteria bacterium]|nr:5-oxoprolinase [Pseudomonadota bacterium]